MKLKSLFTILALSCGITSVALAADQNQNQSNKTKEAEAIAFIITLDKGEVDAAKLTSTKKVDPKVKQFAQYLNQQHSQNLQQVKQLSKTLKVKPDNTADVIALQNDSKAQEKNLKGLKGKDYQKAYIDAMVNDHQKAVDLLDQESQAVSNEKLKKFIEATRDHVQQHLDKAKELQSELG